MDEVLKSDVFKVIFAIAVFFFSVFITVKVYREDIDVDQYKLASAGLAASVFVYLFYLTMG